MTSDVESGRKGSRRSAGAVSVDVRLLHSSGIGTYLQNLLPRLIEEHPEVGFRLLGIEGDTTHEWARHARVRRIELGAPLYSIREQVAIPMRTPRDTDLFWSPHYNIPLLYRGKLLVTLHDLAHLARPEFVRGPHRRAYARMMFRAVSKATLRLFDSRFTADEYARAVGQAAADDAVVYPGVDDTWFAIEKGSPPHAKPYLLFVGNIKPHKNLGSLMRVFAEMKDEIPHDLVIVGRKDGFIHGDRAVLKLSAEIEDRVVFTGWVDDTRLKQYFAHAEALVFPSFYEGFGLPPLEAMACGCPAIVSRVASLPEVCGDAALYCDPGEPASIGRKIRELLGDSVLREDLVARGRERARAFTWERCAEETGQIMRMLLER